MLLLKNDPRYNEQWPRAVVPYRRVYGINEPPVLPALANDGRSSPLLPPGSPFGLVGTFAQGVTLGALLQGIHVELASGENTSIRFANTRDAGPLSALEQRALGIPP